MPLSQADSNRIPDLDDDPFEELQGIYHYYAIKLDVIEPHNEKGQYMTSNNFQRLLGDSGCLAGSDLHVGDIDYIYRQHAYDDLTARELIPKSQRVGWKKPMEARMSYHQFHSALKQLAFLLYPDEGTPTASYNRLFTTCLYPYSRKEPPIVTARDEMTTQPVVNLFESSREMMRRVYKFYALKPIVTKETIDWTDVKSVKAKTPYMTQQSLERLLLDFKLLPMFITHVQLGPLLLSVKGNTPHEGFSLYELCDVLTRVALAYQSPTKRLQKMDKIKLMFETMQVPFRSTFGEAAKSEPPREILTSEELAELMNEREPHAETPLSPGDAMVDAVGNLGEYAYDDEDIDDIEDIDIHFELRGLAERIFDHYCTFDDPNNSGKLTKKKWLLFTRDFNLVKKQDYADDVYMKYATKEPFLMMSIDGFLDALSELRDVRVKGESVDDRAEKLFLRLHGMFEVYRLKVHPDTKSRLRELSLTNKEIKDFEILMKFQQLPKRTIDVYSGPVVCARIDDDPGILQSSKGLKHSVKHPFFSCEIFDEMSEKTILREINLSESFAELLQRIRRKGYDFAAPQDLDTRKPIGRAWRIRDVTGKDFGCFWDYPGQFSDNEWQPMPGFAENSKITATMYCAHSEQPSEYIRVWSLYSHTGDIRKFREGVEQCGLRIDPEMYNPQ
eukprot:GFYU01008151.1.p1 GENE.GFYU01008151.1~~GFYU01008151.1.p1  ORF type:complete len:672 (-),score=165.08 GFYU01008151.1:127-2142(-)